MERRRRLREQAHALSVTGREPTARELAEASGIPLELVVEAMTAPLEVASLEDIAPTELVDSTTPGAELEAIGNHQVGVVVEAVHRLGERKREIVSRHFGIGRRPETLAHIAADLDLSPSRTRSLKDAALHELGADLKPAFEAIAS